MSSSRRRAKRAPALEVLESVEDDDIVPLPKAPKCTLYEVATQPDKYPNAAGAEKKLSADVAFLHTVSLLFAEQQKAVNAPFIPAAQFTPEESITEEVAGKVAHWKGDPVPLKE